jgi:hypothetical protein
MSWLVPAVLALGGCSGSESAKNAPTVWLAPDGSPAQVRLVDFEPPHF